MEAHFLNEAFLFVLIGIITGIISGLLGIGGGLLIVPGLVFVYGLLEFPENIMMQMAIGTSLCIMICTAVSSMLAHWRNDNISWPMFRLIAPGLVFGVAIGAFLAKVLHSGWLEGFFGTFLMLWSIKMMIGFGDECEPHKMPSKKVFLAAGSVIGIPAGLLGIGGGILSVPFMSYFGTPLKRAIGTSAAFTFLVAVIGTASFIVSPRGALSVPFSTGYIYWPAFLFTAPFTVVFAPLGVWLTVHLPSRALRMVFAALLFLIGIKMLYL